MSWNISEVARRISTYLLERLLQRISGSILYSSRWVFFFKNWNNSMVGRFVEFRQGGIFDGVRCDLRSIDIRCFTYFFKVKLYIGSSYFESVLFFNFFLLLLFFEI